MLKCATISAVKRAINKAVDSVAVPLPDRVLTMSDSTVRVNWDKDRYGNNRATITNNWEGLDIRIIVEESEENEWSIWMDPTLPVLIASEPKLESVAELDDMISLLKRSRALFGAVIKNVEAL